MHIEETCTIRASKLRSCLLNSCVHTIIYNIDKSASVIHTSISTTFTGELNHHHHHLFLKVHLFHAKLGLEDDVPDDDDDVPE